MKRMLWLATSARQAVFDELFEECGVVPYYYNLQEIPSLSAFVVREKTLIDQDYFAVDLSGATYTDEDIMTAVRTLRCQSAARPVFLAPSCEATDVLFGLLANSRIRDLIHTDAEDLQNVMRQCLSEEGSALCNQVAALQQGMAKRAVRMIQPLVAPEDKMLAVAVAGTLPRIGVTTQAILICTYLRSVGLSPLLVDTTGTLYPSMQAVYGESCQEKDGYILANGLSVYTGNAPEETLLSSGAFDICVTDFGLLSDNNIGAFAAQPTRILVAGVKPWELPALAAANTLLPEIPYQTIASFATIDALDKIRPYLHGAAELASYQPDPFSAANDLTPYQHLLLPELQKVCAA